MPTRSESPAAVSGPSSKTLQLLRKRLRRLLHIMLVSTICLAVAATALAIRWLTSLNGLPDIGDPFDVAAFRTSSLHDDQNAFTFFRRSWKAIEPTYGGDWSETNPEFRAFVEANRPAVELILKGAEQVDGISGPVGEPLPGEINSDLDSAYPLQASSWGLIGIMLMEGGLREERGDMAGAWDCYRAALRMTVHVRRRERLKDRARQSLAPSTAETSRDLGGGSQDHDPPGSTRPGGGRRVPAQARVGCVHTQDRVSGPHAIPGPARRSPSRADRGGVDLSSG
jgi:hypothetical protein